MAFFLIMCGFRWAPRSALHVKQSLAGGWDSLSTSSQVAGDASCALSCGGLSLGAHRSTAVRSRPQRPLPSQSQEPTHSVDKRDDSLPAPWLAWPPGVPGFREPGSPSQSCGLQPTQTGNVKEPGDESLTWCRCFT